MDQEEKRTILEIIRTEYRNPDGVVKSILDGMPHRHRDVIFHRVVDGKSWFQVEEICHYSERQGRNLLNEGLEMFRESYFQV